MATDRFFASANSRSGAELSCLLPATRWLHFPGGVRRGTTLPMVVHKASACGYQGQACDRDR